MRASPPAAVSKGPPPRALLGPFDKGAPPLPQGAAALRAAVTLLKGEAVGKKLMTAATSQWRLYTEHCTKMSVAPLPWNTDACFLHLTQKAATAGSATSIRNHMSMLRGYARRMALGPDFSDAQWVIMDMHMRDLERTYGTYHISPPPMEWRRLQSCMRATNETDGLSKATLMTAALAHACGMRPNEFCKPQDPRKVMVRVQDITVYPRTEAFPFGAVEVELYMRKDTVATGFELHLASTVTGEPQCAELDFVAFLQTEFHKYDLLNAPGEPLFPELDSNGNRRFSGAVPFRGATPMSADKFNANLTKAFARASVDKAGRTARSLRIGRSTQLAESGTPEGVRNALMGHKRKSSGSRYIGISKMLLPATRERPASEHAADPIEEYE